MKEEERQRRLEVSALRIESQKQLKQKRAELNSLKRNPDVKRYLQLQEELENVEFLTAYEIIREEMRRSRSRYGNDCSHDIWYYCGGYHVEYDFGPESRDTYYQVNDSEDVTVYIYRCLDCYHEEEVLVKDNEKFLKEHCVIKTKLGFDIVREIYSELLCTNRVDRAYEKLLKRISL